MLKKLAFIMDGIPKINKEDTKITGNIEEIENNEEVKSELEDNVPNWIAKAYGSKSDKKSFYDPRELERRKSYAGYTMVGTITKRSSSNNDLEGSKEEPPRRHSQTDVNSKEVYSYNLMGDPTIDAKTVSAWVAIGYGNSDSDYYKAYSEKLLNSERLRKNQ